MAAVLALALFLVFAIALPLALHLALAVPVLFFVLAFVMVVMSMVVGLAGQRRGDQRDGQANRDEGKDSFHGQWCSAQASHAMRRGSKCCELKPNEQKMLYQFMSSTRNIHQGCKAVDAGVIKNMSRLRLSSLDLQVFDAVKEE